MDIYLDIETLPDQTPGALEAHLKAARESFKAPFGLTKGQMIKDLSAANVVLRSGAETLTPEHNDYGKFTAAGDLKVIWEEQFRDDLSGPLAE